MIQQRKSDVQKSKYSYASKCNTQTTPADIRCLRNNATPHINFFMQYVSDYFNGIGLTCVYKLDLRTILEIILSLFLSRKVY